MAGPSSSRHNKHPTYPKNKHPTKKPRGKTGGAGSRTGSRTKGKLECDTLSVTQINLKRKRNAWGTLLSNIRGKKNPIILVTEPHTDTNHHITTTNRDLQSYYCKKGEQRPRAALIVHKQLESRCWELEQFTTPDLVAIKIKREEKELILASSYMDITKTAPPPETLPIVKYAEQHKLPLIVGSDTNGHHTLWGNKECNDRGDDLLDFLTSFGLSWTNKGVKPTFLNSRGQNSIIDLTITNNHGEELISNWHVSDKYSNSDHCYIMFDITSKTKTEPKKSG